MAFMPMHLPMHMHVYLSKFLSTLSMIYHIFYVAWGCAKSWYARIFATYFAQCFYFIILRNGNALAGYQQGASLRAPAGY